MATFSVDSDELECLVTAMQAIRGHLDSVDQARPDRADFGDDHELADAVDRFIGNWSDGRDRISKNIEALASGVDTAAQGYRACDEDVAGAAGGR